MGSIAFLSISFSHILDHNNLEIYSTRHELAHNLSARLKCVISSSARHHGEARHRKKWSTELEHESGKMVLPLSSPQSQNAQDFIGPISFIDFKQSGIHRQSNEALCKHWIHLHLFFTVHTILCIMSESIEDVDRKYCHMLSFLD
jgi:hypothetical protein